MSVRYLNIEAKHRQMTGYLASVKDFSVSPGDETDADTILANPNISLYCLDDVNQAAIFVELPDDIDLAVAPFVYQTQYEQALRLLTVPYETFRQIGYALPAVQNLIMIYMSGRSGSTLVNAILNRLDGVVSLSEPDVATQFVHLRDANGQRDPELRELLDCTMRILAKPTPFKTPTHFAVKVRNEGVQVMDLYQTTFPQAKNLYLYRDALGFITSFYRIFKRAGFPEMSPLEEYFQMAQKLFRLDAQRMIPLLDTNVQQISIPEQLTLWWLLSLEEYLAQYNRSIPVLAVLYSDLISTREQVVSAIFEFCGLPMSQLAAALTAFEQDSQAGTDLARENPAEGNSQRLTDDQLEDIVRILQRHPFINDPDYVVPGTLQV